MKNQIDKDEFDEWAKNKWVEYASESLPRGHRGLMFRLIIKYSLNGMFIVSLGSKVIYEGSSFDEAKNVYNNA